MRQVRPLDPLKAKKRQRNLVVVFALIAALVLDDSATPGQQFIGTSLTPYFAAAGICAALGLASWYYYQRMIPKELQKEFKASAQTWSWTTSQLDIPPSLVFAFGVGFLATELVVSPALAFVTILAYLAVGLLAYLRARGKWASPYFVTVVFYSVSTTAAPFGGVLAVHPNYLVQFGVSLYLARSAAYLFFMASFTGLTMSTVYLAASSWRTRLLMNNRLSIMDLEDIQGMATAQLSRVPGVDMTTLDSALSDIPATHEMFREGNFAVTLALGWAVIERILLQLQSGEKPMEAARKLGFWQQSLSDVYIARNKQAHRGYKASSMEALDTLKEIKRLLEFLANRASSGNSAEPSSS